MRAFATIVAATAATILVVTLANGSPQSNYEQAQTLAKRAATLETEAKTLRTEADALAVVLKPTTEQPKEQAVWAPASTSQKPLSDEAARGCVHHMPEQRPTNVSANNTVPSDAALLAFHEQAALGFNVMAKYVTGRPGLASPSTDDLIQWASCKWGIPTEIERAQVYEESKWFNLDGVGKGLGDEACGASKAEEEQIPAIARKGGGCIYTSLSLAQVKWRLNNSPQPGTNPLRWQSTAFALDYLGATVRFYYDGFCPSWVGSGCTAGNQWRSIAAWFSPNPWTGNSGATKYEGEVQHWLAEKPWTKAGF